jgi:hypothetical protein
MKKVFSFLLLLAISTAAIGDSLYVSYRWVQPGGVAFTESWNIVNTTYDTGTAEGMIKLADQIASERGVEAVVITYVRVLRGHRFEKRSGRDIFI